MRVFIPHAEYAAASRLYGLAEIHAARPDLVLLPDEPYVFTPADGPEAFPATRTVLVPGRQLTWYGPSLATARGELADMIGRPTVG